jgi:hypothetical protein
MVVLKHKDEGEQVARPRWLHGSRRSWERVGFLKLAALLISRYGPSEDFVQKVKMHINSAVNVSYDPELVSWLSSNGLLNRQELKEIASKRNIDIRLQHWWAFNTSVQTGWLSREAIPECFGFFPRKTGILEDNFDISELGRTLLLGFMPSDEIAAWEGTSVSARSPLILTRGQRVFFVYSVLKADGDFLLPLLMEWAHSFGSKTFTYLDAGKLMPSALDRMAANFRGSAYSTDDQREISEIERVRDLVTQQNEMKIEKMGSGSRREQMSIPRLEWLVDLGVLRKESTRSYRFGKEGLILVNDLVTHYQDLSSKYYPEDCLLKLLNQHLFGPTLRFLCGQAKQVELNDCLRLLKEAYQVAKGTLGYVLLRSLLLLIHGWQAETDTPTFVEYDDALQAVETESRLDPESVYYTIDRLGNEHQVKFAA